MTYAKPVTEITIPFPDDWHCHLRDGDSLQRTVDDTSRHFQRAIVMPNLAPPITTVTAAKAYQQRILAALPAERNFTPLMTLYLTETLSPKEIQPDIITAAKLYPAGATTHSHAGVHDIKKIYPLLETMQKHDMPLLIHGEVVDHNVDILNREAQFIDTQLNTLIQDFPELRIVLEHISTKTAVEFIQAAPSHIAATITIHHLLLNLNDLLANGIKPHYYCKPVVKCIEDQQALIQAALSGNPKFFLGTDSAPHTRGQKECASGCAGIYTAHAAIELYAEFFDQHHQLDKLAAFASTFGATFYQLPCNTEPMTLIRSAWSIPESLPLGDETLIPFQAGQTIHWQIKP